MTIDYVKSLFPYFGGKQHAAPFIWAALGDVAHYVEPFAGTMAVLLRRPHVANRAYYSETVNDIDGLLVNMWRALRADPDGLAEAVSWPVTEADLTARHMALVRWRAERDLERLLGDPDWYDLRMAGYWLYGICAWIGGGWCSGQGPWVVGPHGGIMRRAAINAEPGVPRRLPHMSGNGQGVHRGNLRNAGVGNAEPGVPRQLPHMSGNGRGVHRGNLRDAGVGDDPAWHPMTMPELRNWMGYLSARLRHVRILNGDWKRALTQSVVKTLPVRMGDGVAGVFLDPPYSGDVRTPNLYAHDSHSIAMDVRRWCLEHGSDPQLRIVLAGFAGEGHEELEAHGWRCVEWWRPGFLRGGMAQQSERGTQQHRERLWLSPHCLGGPVKRLPMDDLWGEDDNDNDDDDDLD